MSDAGIVVLGLGNPLMGDDGVGLAALEVLRDGWTIEGAELVDGGTWGMSLLPTLEDCGAALLLDAVTSGGGAAGELVRLERGQLHLRFGHKLSPHQVDLLEVLALAELRGTLPERLVALGIEAGEIAFQQAMTPPVAAAIPALVDAAVAQLRAWGVRCTPHPAPQAA